MQFDKVQLRKLLGPSVYIAEEEIPVFCHFVSLAKNILVDIGAGWGASAFLMLVNAPRDAFIFSIDSFAGDTIKPWKEITEKICRKNVERALIAVGEANELQRWKLFSQPSHQIAIHWNREIDLVYIDGDHRYEGVKQDFEDWFKFVNPNGIILLHDSRRLSGVPIETFARGWPGPTQLALELKNRQDIKLLDEVFSLTVWEKNEINTGI